MNISARDYVGMWYQARADLGVDDLSDYIFVEPATGKRTSIRLRHRDQDGVGGILISARRVGLAPPVVPVTKPRKPPAFWRRWLARPQSRKAVAPRWRQADATNASSVSPLIDWLSVEQTSALSRYADTQNVSMNSLLLLALHRAVSATLLDSDGPGSWCFPVNMRNAISAPRQEMNLSSAFYMTVAAEDSPQDVDRLVRANLKDNVHWRLWHLARIGRFIGQRGVNWLCARMLKGTSHVGSFSSLGEWQMDFQSAGMPADTVFCCCGPGSPNHPVANGAIVVNGQLSLALRLHPSLGVDQARAELCLQHWLDGLLEYL